MDTLPLHWRQYIREYRDANFLRTSPTELWDHISDCLTTWEISMDIQSKIKQELFPKDVCDVISKYTWKN